MYLEVLRDRGIEVHFARCTVRIARNVTEPCSNNSRSHAVNRAVDRTGRRQREVRIGCGIVVLQRCPVPSRFRQLQKPGVSVGTLRRARNLIGLRDIDRQPGVADKHRRNMPVTQPPRTWRRMTMAMFSTCWESMLLTATSLIRFGPS